MRLWNPPRLTPHNTVALLLLGLAGCNFGDAEEAPPPARPPALVKVETVRQQAVYPRVQVIGSVVPRRTSIVASGSSGVVQNYDVHLGQYVTEGTVLSVLRMETTDLEIKEAEALLLEKFQTWQELETGSRQEDIDEAAAELKSAESVNSFARKNMQRIRELYGRNTINEREMDEANEKAQAAAEALKAAQARYDRVKDGARAEVKAQAKARYEAQQHHVDYLEAEKLKRTTKAPFNGFIVQEHTYRGQWLSAGDPVVSLARLDEVEVTVQVEQWELPHVRLGDTAEIRVQGVHFPEWMGTPLTKLMPAFMVELFSPLSDSTTGRIASVVPSSDWRTGSRSFPIRITLENWLRPLGDTFEPVLKEGMMVEVTFVGQPVEALLVPKDSVVRGTRGSVLFAYNPEKQIVESHTVETGLSEGDWIQIVNSPLQPGMQVVTDGAERLRHFEPVRLSEPAETVAKTE